MKSKKITPLALKEMKEKGEKHTFMPVYDYPFAKILDECGVDVLLVGDSLSTTMYGRADDIYATMEEMIVHAQAVTRAAERALVIVDMPFMSYQASLEDAIRNAGRLMKEGCADAVKLEGGVEIADTVRAIVRAGIPVMGHIGLIDQALRLTGVRRVRGRTKEDKDRLFEDAKAIQEAGAFMIGLVLITVETAREITEMLEIPTNGIGSGPHCDGNGLNLYDMISLTAGDFTPKFVKRYANIKEVTVSAVREYIKEVKEGTFPDLEHSYD